MENICCPFPWINRGLLFFAVHLQYSLDAKWNKGIKRTISISVVICNCKVTLYIFWVLFRFSSIFWWNFWGICVYLVIFAAIGGTTGQLLEQNAQALDQISANFTVFKVSWCFWQFYSYLPHLLFCERWQNGNGPNTWTSHKSHFLFFLLLHLIIC